MTDLKALKEKLSVFDKDFALDAGIQLIGTKSKFSQSGEEFSEEEYKKGIGMSYCPSRMKDFRLGARWSKQKDLKTILQLLEVIELQRDALEKTKTNKNSNSGDWHRANEALTKTDAMLGEL